MTSIDRTISANLHLLFATTPRLRDGDTDAIHDARVATRRLEAALPLGWSASSDGGWQEAAATVRRFGKALGRVRDVDVALERLPALEARVPTAVATIASLRAMLAQEQWEQRRRLIKTLEGLALERLSNARPPRAVSFLGDSRWPAVDRAMAAQAEALRDAVIRASGVYFPNRAHHVRISLKKLRYVVELVAHDRRAALALKRLKRSQETLGELHDHQRLADIVSAAAVPGKADRRILVASLQAAAAGLFNEYLERRSQILDVCDEVRSAGGRGTWRPRSVGETLLTAGAAFAPSALMWLARSRAAAGARRADSAEDDPAATHERDVERSLAPGAAGGQ